VGLEGYAVKAAMSNVSLALSVTDGIPLPEEVNAPGWRDLPGQASPGLVATSRAASMTTGSSSAAQAGTLELAPQDITRGEILRRLLSPVLAEADTGRAADKLLTRFGSLGAILSADAMQLSEVVNNLVAEHLRITYLAMQGALREQIQDRPIIGCWSALEDYAAIKLRHSLDEKLLALFLDRRNGLIHEECMAHGAFDQTPTYCREVARRALELRAHAVALAHNHPAGDPAPSRADVELTKRIIVVLSNLEIAFHDHAVVGRNITMSMQSMHLI
jgi:DNA repair protein RadC